MKILNQLTLQHMKKNKKRTIVTIIGVMLSSTLLFGVGLAISTARDNAIRDTIASSGSQHITLKNYPYDQLHKLETRKDIVITNYYQTLYNMESDSYETIKLFAYPSYDDVHLVDGTYPKPGEIIVPRDYIKMNDANIGDSVLIGDQEYMISGIYDEASIVGYKYKNGYLSNNSAIFTYFDVTENTKININIQFPSLKNIYEQIRSFGTSLGYQIHEYPYEEFAFNEIDINQNLLTYYGQISSTGKVAVFFLSTLFICAILGIFCVFVIYNSFAISVTERKKMFGMFSSVGATPRQLFYSVFFEAFVIGLIAIPLGFLLSVGFVAGILAIINYLLQDVISSSYHLSFYPLYLLLSFIFILLTLMLSAFFPAKRASETTPLRSIQMQESIKRRRSNAKWIGKIFGIEGDLAYKNMKRNKKKFRTTTVSICTSIVLFLSISTYVNYGLRSYDYETTNEPDVNISFDAFKDTDKLVQEIQAIPEIQSSVFYQSAFIYGPKIDDTYYTSAYLSHNPSQTPYEYYFVYALEESDYQNYLKKIGLKEEKAIIYNQSTIYVCKDECSKDELVMYDETKQAKISLCELDTDSQLNNCYTPFSELYYTNISPLETYYAPLGTIIVNSKMYQSILNQLKYQTKYNFVMKVNSIHKFDQNMQEIIKKYPEDIYYYSPKLDNYEVEQQMITIRFVLYSVIGFITLIAVTSVMNTIYTSMQLRKREFAVLRSIGLSMRQLKKTLCLESLLIGLRSLFYGILISLVFIHFIIQPISTLGNIEQKVTIPFPTTYVIICIIGVICIVFFAMWYATRQIKHENIIDSIEEENV